MRVRARAFDPQLIPPDLRPYLGQIFVVPGIEYDVHAVVAFQGMVHFLMVWDIDPPLPGWDPAWLFDVVDASIPNDWICASFHTEPQLLIGPEFIARGHQEYTDMVELVPWQVARFWKYVESRRPQDI